MELDRRSFIALLASVGTTTIGPGWLIDRIMALEAAGELPVTPGPGIESWLPTACGMCPGGCGLEVRQIDGLPVGVRGFARHPVNEGRLCALPHGVIQMLFSPDRVRRPLKRRGRRGTGAWGEISWDEAEGAIRERLQTLIAAGSRTRVAFLDGRRPGVGETVAKGFMEGVGSPHYVPSSDSAAAEVAQRMLGWQMAPGADLERSRVVLLFQFDAFETEGSPVWQTRVYAQARDRTVDRPLYIGVGPRLFGSMSKCDHWLPVRPGGEGIVALAIAHVILGNQWENREFLQSKTDWPETSADNRNGLHDLVNATTPQIASEITGLSSLQIEKVAKQFVEHQPGVALVGGGTPTTPTTALTIAAVNLLNLLVGSVGRLGGMVEVQPPPFQMLWDETPHSSPDQRVAPIRGPGELARVLLENTPEPIDLLFVREANPVFDSAFGQTFRRGLASNDRMVVAFATELDETAMMADLVLPHPSFMERWDAFLGSSPFPRALVTLQQPAIPPLFACRQSEDVLVQLCSKLGNLSRVRFRAEDAESLVRTALRGVMEDTRGSVWGSPATQGAAASPDALWKALQSGIVWAAHEVRAAIKPPALRAQTLPGRLLGLPEEPSQRALREWASPASMGAPDRYPYELVVFRTAQLRDGETANIPMLMELAGHWSETVWVTWAEMHPRTAVQAGIADGDVVRVVSERGHIEAVARVSQATPPGMVAVPLGFGHDEGSTAAHVGANVNQIAAVPVQRFRPTTTRVNLVRI